MKKSNFLLLCFYLITLPFLNAQSLFTGSKKYTEIGFVYAIPIGEFGSTDLDKGGFAAPGYGFSINSKNVLPNGLIFSSNSSYQWNNLDTEAMKIAFDGYFQSSGYTTEVSGGTHSPLFSTVGLGYGIEMGSKGARLDLLPSIGVVYNSFKEFDLEVLSNGSVVFQDLITFDSDFAFAYGFDVEFFVPLFQDTGGLGLYANYKAGNIDTYMRGEQISAIKSTGKMEFITLGFTFALHVTR